MSARAVVRLLGALLLVGACTGAGTAVWRARRRACASTHAFCALLEYLLAGIRYQACPCAELLRRAAQDARFAPLRLESCRTFAALPVPGALGDALQGEARETLAALGGVPRERACALLGRLIGQCRAREASLARRADEAGRLYPRLGFCAGVLAAVVLL